MKSKKTPVIYIPVTISKGMLSTEYAIELILSNGQVVSFFAENYLIKEPDSNCPKLRVFFLSENEDGTLHVLLPQHPFESYGSIWADVLAVSKIPNYSN